METKLEIPEFASESEEADWWYDHREELDGVMADAIENGTARNLHEFLRSEGLLIDPEEVTVSVCPDDVKIAKAAAQLQGVQYEDYLSSLVHDALQAKRAA